MEILCHVEHIFGINKRNASIERIEIDEKYEAIKEVEEIKSRSNYNI